MHYFQSSFNDYFRGGMAAFTRYNPERSTTRMLSGCQKLDQARGKCVDLDKFDLSGSVPKYEQTGFPGRCSSTGRDAMNRPGIMQVGENWIQDGTLLEHAALCVNRFKVRLIGRNRQGEFHPLVMRQFQDEFGIFFRNRPFPQ